MRIQRGDRGSGPPPPWKITGFGPPPPPPLEKVGPPPPPGKCWTPSGTLNNDRFPLEIDHLTSVLKKKKNVVRAFLSDWPGPPPPPPLTKIPGSAHAGSSESIHVKMPHCWKSRVAAHILMCPSLSGCEAGMNEWPSNRSTNVVCVKAWRDGTKFSQASPVSQRCVLEQDTFILQPRKIRPNVTERLLIGT